MSEQIKRLLDALRRFRKAHDQLSRAVPDPSTAGRRADTALEEVLVLLQDPDIVRALDELVPDARHRLLAAPEEFEEQFRTKRSEFIQIELKITNRLGTRESDMLELAASYRRMREESTQFPVDIKSLAQKLVDIHNATKISVNQSRELSRKDKKKRKRKLAQGVASAVFGTGVIVADSQLPVVFAFSYGLGGGALHQALRDIVGEPPE